MQWFFNSIWKRPAFFSLFFSPKGLFCWVLLFLLKEKQKFQSSSWPLKTSFHFFYFSEFIVTQALFVLHCPCCDTIKAEDKVSNLEQKHTI